RNISYQAGGTISFTETSTREETNDFVINFDIAEELALEISVDIGGSGLYIDQKLNINYSFSKAESTTKAASTEFSYTIDDSDPLDDFSVDVFDSKEGYGPIFKTRGGSTACPYQEETKTRYYLPGTIIDQATIQYEQPRITASPSTVYNVPADAEATINLSLINDGLKQEVYALTILEASNPNGAILTIDGIYPNREFAVPASSSITKQLSIKKGPNHIIYDSIGIVFHSTCQYSYSTAFYRDIADTVYISVQFLPSCTDIDISGPDDQFVLNNNFNNTLPVLLSGYDINYGGLEKISLQYKPSAQASWITLGEEWFKDTTDINTRYPNHPNPAKIPTNQPYITYDLNMEQLIDQSYQLRAVSTCEIPGNPDKEEYSTVVGGIADRVNPHPFGTPSPADGVLDPNDDISIQFNEPIESGSLTIDNFQLTGVVNGQELRHDKVVAFDGLTDYMEIGNGFDFASESFTLEFWAKRDQLGTNQILISQGTASNNQLAIGFNSSNQVKLTLGNQSYSSSFSILDDSTWHHYSIVYDKDNLSLNISDRSSSASQSSNINNFYTNYVSGGKTYFGKSSVTDSDFFAGSAHQIRIWNRALTQSQIVSKLNVNLIGREAGLVGYWPMEEGRGSLAE
ncbi:MAG: LamG domain-containing protein, partial [Cyclobacteriaceae bacterium]|nr:LamG domain-containing protein [Cyclobacteriaceae bacterium]